jgi:anti-sigma-K factor RskA
MDYSRPQRADRLAAEYVLGTLRGPARRRFESLLGAHPSLRRATQEWEQRLGTLSVVTPAVTPSEQVWQGIQRRLFGVAATAASPLAQAVQGTVRWWQSLALWQAASGIATAAVLVLSWLLVQPAPVKPPIVIVMAAQTGTDRAAGALGVQPASFVASVSGDGRSLVLKPLNEGQDLTVNKALELWAVPAQGAPRSLGLVARQGTTKVLRTSLLKDTAALAVSVEPAGGSPTGAPTGPIISVGKLQT